MNLLRTLLFRFSFPKHFWSYVMTHDVFIINQILSPILLNESPYSLLHDMLPDLHILNVF